jgi:membrane protease YdiL (CAAX protease family)
MFLEQGIKDENKFSKYLWGSVLMIIASFIGQMPLVLAIGYETMFNGKSYPENDKMLMQFFDSNLTLFYILISFVFVFFAIVLIIKYLHHQTLFSIVTAREKLDWSRIRFSFIIWSFFTIMTTLVMYYYNPSDFVYNFKLVPFLILFVVGTLLIPIQTTVEELVFRGYLMQGFANLSRNKWFPLVMTSLIFGLMHLFNPEVTKFGNIIMVYYIGTGFLLGIMTLMDDGMELALGFHAANNLVGALLVTSDWSAFQTYSVLKDVSESEAGLDIILPVVVIYPLFLIIFGLKYNWSNWKEKLTGSILN